MLTKFQYVFKYPELSKFNNSLTYTRKSKTGKIVTVRKGKRRRKKPDKIFSTLFAIGVGSAGAIAAAKGVNLGLSKIGEQALQNPKLGNFLAKNLTPVVAGGYSGALGVGVGTGLATYKIVRRDRK